VFPVTIHQDAKILRGRLSKGHELSYEINKGRGVWVQVVSGALSINAHSLEAGDAALIEKETNLQFAGHSKSEFLLFDLK